MTISEKLYRQVKVSFSFIAGNLGTSDRTEFGYRRTGAIEYSRG